MTNISKATNIKFLNKDCTLKQEYKDFLIENQYLETKDIAEKFYNTFNKKISICHLRRFLKSLGVYKFSRNTMQIGEISIKPKKNNKNCELYIKTGENKYSTYSRYVYETYYNKKIPDDYVIFHLDLDVFNNNPDNLRLLPAKYSFYVNRYWKDKVSPDDWNLFLLMLELKSVINQKAEELKLRKIKGVRL